MSASRLLSGGLGSGSKAKEGAVTGSLLAGCYRADWGQAVKQKRGQWQAVWGQVGETDFDSVLTAVLNLRVGVLPEVAHWSALGHLASLDPP